MVPVKEDYYVGEVITCGATGYPEPNYRWSAVHSPGARPVTGSKLEITSKLSHTIFLTIEVSLELEKYYICGRDHQMRRDWIPGPLLGQLYTVSHLGLINSWK